MCIQPTGRQLAILPEQPDGTNMEWKITYTCILHTCTHLHMLTFRGLVECAKVLSTCLRSPPPTTRIFVHSVHVYQQIFYVRYYIHLEREREEQTRPSYVPSPGSAAIAARSTAGENPHHDMQPNPSTLPDIFQTSKWSSERQHVPPAAHRTRYGNRFGLRTAPVRWPYGIRALMQNTSTLIECWYTTNVCPTLSDIGFYTTQTHNTLDTVPSSAAPLSWV